MPITQIFLASGTSALPTYTLTPFFSGGPEYVNEGSPLVFNVGGTNVPDGTYYWTIETNSGDFATVSGTVIVTGTTGPYLGNIEITPTADATTEGAETFTVALRSGSINGEILATSIAVAITDISLTPAAEPPFSLQFDQPQGDYLSTPASADWNLGTTWTIEFWMNANRSGDGSANMTGGIWGLLNQEGWAATNAINIAISDSKLVVGQGAQYDDVRYTEPTPAQWTHVAIVNNAGAQTVWYNGSEQTKVSGTFGTANYTNSTDSLAIGNMSGGNNSFDGKMALVRISNAAKYSAAFTPTVTYGVDADTKLFLDSNTPLLDAMSHTITNNGVTESTTFVNRYTVLHSAVNGGSTNVHIESNPTNDAWAGSVPIGASIISQISGRFTVNSSGRDANNNWVFYIGAGPIGGFTAGETHTFIW